MPPKQQPLGICDHCLGPIPPDLGDYTSKGRPRLYCSRDCLNTANSRAGKPIRVAKLRQAVARGTWQNPADINPPDPANVAAGISRSKKAAVERGEWRNPALDDAAREKLSRPRKHADNPVLHRAIEKLRGGTMTDLTEEEHAAWLAHQAELRAARRDEVNAKRREWYRRRKKAGQE